MADVYLDCEWIGGDYLTIVGAYSYGQDRFQLYDNTLTRNRLSRFLNLCSGRSGKSNSFLFCHGPDIGRIERHFGMDLKSTCYCVNTITAFQRYTKFEDVSLSHLERYFGLGRRYALSPEEMYELWKSRRRRDRQVVLDYNWEDCVNLRRLVSILKREYGVTQGILKEISMQSP